MGQSNLSIKKTDTRRRLYDDLQKATGEGTTSGAIDAAARQYLRLSGGSSVEAGQGRVRALMDRAEKQGSVTAEEIADHLSTEEFPVRYTREREIGPE